MSLQEELNDLFQAVSTQDQDSLKRIINKYVDSKDSELIKCNECNSVLAVYPLTKLYSEGVERHSMIKYIVLKHMVSCKNHDVSIPMMAFSYPISQILETKLRQHCINHGVVFEEWFPGYVNDHYYNKIKDKYNIS